LIPVNAIRIVEPAWRLRLPLVVSALILVCSPIRAGAQDLWYQAYTAGVQAFNRGDLVTAERKLTDALNAKNASPARGRKVLYYSQIRDEFLPEYYLAVVLARQGKYAEAIAFANKAEPYMKGDRDYAKLVAARTDAERGLKPPVVAEVRPPPPPPPPPVTTIPPSTGPTAEELRAAAARGNFDRLFGEATRAAAAGRWADARLSANQARGLGIDNKRTDDLLKTIDVQDLTAQLNARLASRQWQAAQALVARVAGLDPANTAVVEGRQRIARGLADDGERGGLGAFYRGQYQQALDILNGVPADIRTPRIVFYMACSNAALGLLDGPKGRGRLQSARDLFKGIRPNLSGLTVDRRYISPTIIRALEGVSN
jgi:tetratricopeptide (TPR) repeat protein